MTQLTLLPDYGVISISGPDAKTYLQGQLTCDMTQLKERGWLAGCHCDAKGKMWSNFLITQLESAICLVMRKGALGSSLAALQKFGVFSKVDITDASEQIQVYGVEGEAESTDAFTLIPFSAERGLALSTQALEASGKASQWQLQQIQAGRPELEVESMCGEFVPQMLNQAELGAISFQKGCYIGQETVARMKYLGKQKRASFYLQGSGQTLKAGDELEVERNGNWRRAGLVVNAVQTEGEWHLLAVLASDANNTETYRLSGDESSQLKVQALPYELEFQKES